MTSSRDVSLIMARFDTTGRDNKRDFELCNGALQCHSSFSTSLAQKFLSASFLVSSASIASFASIL
jgi:hypothetical protein